MKRIIKFIALLSIFVLNLNADYKKNTNSENLLWDEARYFTLAKTLGNGVIDNQHHDNEWMSDDEEDISQSDRSNVVTHLLMKIKDEHIIDNDTRMPLIIIHGTDGTGGDSDPLKKAVDNSIYEGINKQATFLIDKQDGYFENLNQLLKRKDLASKFRVYYYSYPSQKHITYNGRKLSNLLGEDTYIMDWINKGKKVLFLAHSMGGLVTRSMLEEHEGIWYEEPKNNWNKIPTSNFLGGLITLGTPHHGSPTAISSWFDSANYDVFNWATPDRTTPGMQDLFWDNYDGVLFHSSVLKDIYKDFTAYDNYNYNCNDIELTKHDSIEEINIYNLIKDKNLKSFDNVFSSRLILNNNTNCLRLQTSSKKDSYGLREDAYQYKIINIPLPNPWLSYLNSKLSNADKSKYYFYGGINDTDNNHVSNIMNDEFGSNGATTDMLYNSGYFSDYIVPTSSSIYDTNYAMKTPTSGKLFDDFGIGGKVSGPSWLWTFIENKNKYFYKNENSAPKIRFFKDYHHTRMKSGGYRSFKSDLFSETDKYPDAYIISVRSHGITNGNNLLKYISQVLYSTDYNSFLEKNLELLYRKKEGSSQRNITEYNTLFPKLKLYFDPLYIQISKDLKEIYCKNQANACNIPKNNGEWYVEHLKMLNTTLKDNSYDNKAIEDNIKRGKFLRLALVAFGIASDGLTDIQYRDIAREIGIIKNEGDGRLDDLIQKDESAKIIVLLSKLEIESGVISENIKVDMSEFDDYEDLKNSWYFSEGYFLHAYDKGIVTGASNDGKKRLELLKNINYAEAIKMISVATCTKWCRDKDTNCSPDVLMECISSSIGGK